MDDMPRFGRAGGVPVQVWNQSTGPHRPTAILNITLADEGPGSLREPWLNRVGVGVSITHAGEVTFTDLASGDADRAGLEAELAAVHPRTTDLINESRAEAGLPPVRLDPALVDSAKQWLTESVRRGCFMGFAVPSGCAGADPPVGDRWSAQRDVLGGAEDAFTFYLGLAEPGDDQLKRFGAAAVLGPDGTLWTAVVFAR